ncbi:MAG: sensor histidine kinase [Bacilli bacterium]
MLYTNYWIEATYFNGNSPIAYYVLTAFFIVLVVLISYVNLKCTNIENNFQINLKNTQLSDLSVYVSEVESMYDDIRRFRHDYINVIISLNESVNSNNIGIIKNTYSEVLSKNKIVLDDEKHSITCLSNITKNPIKSIFSSKIIQAFDSGINVNIEIEDVIEGDNIDLLDYIRIISILLDNAIEASLKSCEKIINVALFNDVNKKCTFIIIENTFNDPHIDISKMFTKGYSTKGENRGIGLEIVQKIVNDYPNLILNTSYINSLFRQEIIISEVDF